MTAGEISFYVDTLLVETVLENPEHFHKKGGLVSDLLAKVKGYFSSKIDPNHPVDSVLNELAPGAVWLIFRSLGMGTWGLLISLLMSVFHVDVMGFFTTVYGEVKNMLSSGNKVSSQQVDSVIDSAVEQHSQVTSPTEAQEGAEALQKMQQSGSPADDGKVYSSLELLHDAKFIRLAMIEYDKQNLRLVKDAKPSNFLNGYSGSKAKGTSLLGRVLGWIIKLALASAGLMVAGDIVNKLFDRPNSLDGSYQAGQTSQPGSTPGVVGPTQTKYHATGDAPIPREMPIVNTLDNISNMVIQFAKEVYSGLDGKENIIRSTPGFQSVVRRIAWANVYNQGSQTTMIPPDFGTKKQLVDRFIDQVAAADKA